MNTSRCAAAVVALVLLPICANAQQMTLEIRNGLVTLETQNVPVRQILSEWARVGGATIVNGDKVVGAPLTLQLQNVPERQALDIILRGVSGYMLAVRQDANAGASTFDRIMILPTSSAPRPAPVQAGFSNPAMRPAPVQPVPMDTTEEMVQDGDEEDNDGPEEPEAIEEGAGEPSAMPPNINRFQRRGQVFPNPMGAAPQPFSPQPGPGQVFPAQPVNPSAPGQLPPPVNTPFGIPAGASTVPGVVTPAPQTPTTAAPTRPRTRPPGVQ